MRDEIPSTHAKELVRVWDTGAHYQDHNERPKRSNREQHVTTTTTAPFFLLFADDVHLFGCSEMVHPYKPEIMRRSTSRVSHEWDS